MPYYTNAVQCRFFNGKEMEYGITFHSYTISALTGEAYLNEYCRAAAENAGLDDWITELEWYDLTLHKISD